MSAVTTPDADLRYWLANEDWYMSRYTREWLQRTPGDEASDTLAAIAVDAVAEPRAPWAVMATVVASAGLATSDGIGGKGPGARKAGTRAALILAELNDLRCISPLVRVFSTGGFLQSKYQSQIESALFQVLSGIENTHDSARYTPDVRELVERIWKSGERRDLSPAHADLVIAGIKFLHNVGGPDNLATVHAIISDQSASAARQPQRARVKQAAELLR
jgi:hypothetical protein